MTAQQLQEFEADLAAATNLSENEKVAIKQEFFQKHIAGDPEWSGLAPQDRMAFARKFGIAPGFAQLQEGEFAQHNLLSSGPGVQAGPPSRSDELRSRLYQNNLGSVEEPNMFLDPVNALTGGTASLLSKAPMIGGMLAARNPLIREAAKRGILGSAMDWQTMGLNRLPGFIGRQASKAWQHLKPQSPSTQPFGGWGPQGGAGPFKGEMIPEPRPSGPTKIPTGGGPQMPAPMQPQTGNVMGLADPSKMPNYPKPKIRYGPGGIEVQ